jgi:hypothetical protein
MNADAQEFGRQVSIVVSSASTTVELNQFRCVFSVNRVDTQSPNSCDVKVYNLSSPAQSII